MKIKTRRISKSKIVAGAAACLSVLGTDVGAAVGQAAAPAIAPVLGLTWPVSTLEAESGRLGGSATVVGSPDESDRAVGDLGGEASHRMAVTLSKAGDAVSWVVTSALAGANAIVVRFSIPDAPAGGGLPGSLNFSVKSATGQMRLTKTLRLTSRYSWVYGGVKDGTKLYNQPANAAKYATASTATHLYDEIQLRLGLELQTGDVIALTNAAAGSALAITVDFLDLEKTPAPLQNPTGFLSIDERRCGAIASDLRKTGEVFDGVDDSSYGSIFNSVQGINPSNPISFRVNEKDYYSTAPVHDALQDTSPNSATSGLSMFQLADHNFQSLQTCVQIVSAPGSGFIGVYIPPGRFYVRGVLPLPSKMTIQGAGMWYSKFVAVDTATPLAVTARGNTGIASASGNLTFTSASGGSDHLTLSNFAIFGNVTQRDVADTPLPHGVIGEFTNSTIDNLWVEHTFTGIKTNGNSSNVQIANSRVRNVFADGIAFYGSTSQSVIKNSAVRSSGDDGFAMWAQGTTPASISRGNAITDSTAQLQWFGNGFAMYGGTGGSVTQSTAADILNYPCLQMSTEFVSPSLPSTAEMTASASKLNLYRCGGNGFNQRFGALLIKTNRENINGLTVDEVTIVKPTYVGIDIRKSPARTAIELGTHRSVAIHDATIIAAPTCSAVGAYTGGEAQLSNVCSCAAASSAAGRCEVSNASPSTFSITNTGCSLQMCRGYGPE